jgi:hypothetical protein
VSRLNNVSKLTGQAWGLPVFLAIPLMPLALDFNSVMPVEMFEKMYLASCVLVGAVMCFFGRRAFKLTLGLFGALVGGYAAAAVGFRLSDGKEAVALFCGLTGGVLGGVLMVTVYLLGVFVAGATLGGIVAAVFTMEAAPGDRAMAVSIAAAVSGLLVLFAQRFLITVATALNGAALVVGCMWLLYADLSAVEACSLYVSAGAGGSAASPDAVYRYILICGWATLGCLGAWVQFSTHVEPEPEAGRGASPDASDE